jgi:hypothetical protein
MGLGRGFATLPWVKKGGLRQVRQASLHAMPRRIPNNFQFNGVGNLRNYIECMRIGGYSR